jgi:hypothetical protein
MGDKPGHPFRGNQWGAKTRVAIMEAPSAPPVLKWKKPPPPKGKAGGKAGGFAANGKTNTDVGDTAEAALVDLGFEDAHPGRRQGPLDVTLGDYGFEVKAVTTASGEYKVKMKGHEQKEKLEAARKKKLKPGTMIVVMDYKKGQAHAYWRDGIGNFRLNPKNQGEWNYMGTAQVGK